MPPFPFDPYAGVIPIYSLPSSPGQYLVADTPTDYAQLQALQVELKSGGGMMMNSLEFPGEGDTNGGGSGSWEYTPIVYGSNDLWLEVVPGSVTNGTANLIIHNPESLTNEVTWYVWGTTNFAFCENLWAWDADNWTWLAVAEPGETNLTVPQLSDIASFYRLADPANDADGDGITDYYSWLHFGHPLGWSNDLSRAVDDYDSDGYYNGTEYTNNTNPNDVAFTVRFPDEFVNQTNVTGTCVVSAGIPYEMAVLVNSTNFGAATWLPYASTFTASLGATDAVYTVGVALRGRSPEFPPVRDEAQLILDRVAPTLAVTNPIGSTVIKPYLQLQGWANEPLRSVSYNLSNAFELITNVPASVVDEAFDTNSFDFTTNWFQAYDVPLATNLNHILLSVADRAGNVSSTNLLITLDYSGATNPPVTQLQWPTNGLTIAGTNMTLRGQINDETASVSVYWVSGGETNYWPGVVERNGQFWIEQLPLNAGTNQLTLRAVDAAGNVSENGFTAIRGSLTVSVGTTPDLYEPSGTVSGTVSDPDASVSVNGVAATVDEYGQWSADNVPLYGDGVAVFDLTATPPSGAPQEFTCTIEKPAAIRVVKHYVKQTLQTSTSAHNWSKTYRTWDEQGTRASVRRRYLGTATGYWSPWIYGTSLINYIWNDSNAFGSYHATHSLGGDSSGPLGEADWQIRSVPDQQFDHSVGLSDKYVTHFYARGVRHEWPDGEGMAVETLEARTRLRLYTGGKAEVGKQSLFAVQAEVREYGQPFSYEWFYTPEEIVARERVSINGERVDAEGKIWRVLAANSTMDVNIKSDASQHYKASYDMTQHKLVIKANGVVLDENTVTNGADFCVGQEIKFEVAGLLSFRDINEDVAKWKLSGTFVNTNSDPNCDLYYERNNALLTRRQVPDGTTATRCWYVLGASQATVSVVAYYRINATGGILVERLKGKFNVHRPTTTFIPPSSIDGTPTVIVTNGWLSLGWNRSNDMSFGHQITPGSFAGQAGYVQLVSGEYTLSSTGLEVDVSTNGLALDNAEFYRGISSIAANTATNTVFFDGPRDGLYLPTGGAKMDLEFKTYLLFKPDAGPGQNIFVPLNLRLWELHAEAANHAVVPNGQAVKGPDPSDSTAFPHWNSVWTPP